MGKGVEHWELSYIAEGRVTWEINLALSPKCECLHTPLPTSYAPGYVAKKNMYKRHVQEYS